VFYVKTTSSSWGNERSLKNAFVEGCHGEEGGAGVKKAGKNQVSI